jgi:AraC family transcriptional regulator
MTASDSVHQAVQYIYDHIAEELSVDSVADAVCFSRYHFSRVFKAFTGESLYGFIKRLRLERSAFRLIRLPGMTVTEIAAEAGMSSSNFAVAFKDHFGRSPAEYRSRPPERVRDSLKEVLTLLDNRELSRTEIDRIGNLVTIRHLGEMILFGDKYRGRYSEMGPAWESFCQRIMKDPDMVRPPVFVGISRDDPMIADEKSCWYDITALVNRRKGPGTVVLPAGEYACLSFKGPVDNIGRCYNELVSLWLLQSDRELGDGPLFEIYLTAPDENRHVTADICAPLKT